MRPLSRLVPAALQLGIGLACVALLVGVIGKALGVRAQQRIPPGWKIVRPPLDVMSLAIIGDEVWAGGRDGVFRFSRQTAAPLPLPTGLAEVRLVKALLRDREGALWIASDAGLARCIDTSITRWTVAQGTFPADARALLEDRDGTLWIGTGNGVLTYRNGVMSPVSTPSALALRDVDVLYQTRDGAIWMGSASPSTGALYRYDGAAWKRYTTTEGLIHPSVNAIAEDRTGALWVGTGFADKGGACALRQARWNCITKSDGLAGEKVRSVFEDRMGRLLLGSEYDGLTIRVDTSLVVIRPGGGLAGREVKAILQDVDGVFWLGTDSGLNRIEHLPD